MQEINHFSWADACNMSVCSEHERALLSLAAAAIWKGPVNSHITCDKHEAKTVIFQLLRCASVLTKGAHNKKKIGKKTHLYAAKLPWQ